ncbi:MAG: Rne/Rng family ribonuclease [Candidatus Alcyoniella australis]|nr:Rne/Rng family ribonuclease [Candidatus Alcyoniella australis]
MEAELLINVTSDESRVALLESGVVTEFFVERRSRRSLVGNIYKGRVVRVLPGMQAAFVDIGLDRAAFLYVADVIEDLESHFNAHGEQWINGIEEQRSLRSEGTVPIQKLLQEGQEILVQVAKEPLGTKGARVSSHVSLPGQTLVLLPTMDHVGVSRRIESEQERDRLRKVLESIRQPTMGAIVRTAAEGQDESVLRNDIQMLLNLWNSIRERNRVAGAPSLLHSELSLGLRAVRDLCSLGLKRVMVDDEEEQKRIHDVLEPMMALNLPPIEYYDAPEPLFDVHGLEVELSRALQRKVWLRSGGFIVIEQTEALAVVDVNTGRFVGKHNLEDTILKTNLEAVREICYQLRLRNIGGIIIIDFIDMERQVDRQRVLSAIEDGLRTDRSRTSVHHISELGLVEMTRKRTRESLLHVLSEPCPYCEGKGQIRSAVSIASEVMRRLRAEAASGRSSKLVAKVHPQIASLLMDEEHGFLEQIEVMHGTQIQVRSHPEYHVEQYNIVNL